MVIIWYVGVFHGMHDLSSKHTDESYCSCSSQGEKPTWPTNFGIECCKKMKYVLGLFVYFFFKSQMSHIKLSVIVRQYLSSDLDSKCTSIKVDYTPSES